MIEFLNAFVRLLPELGFGVLAVVILAAAWMVGRVRRITHAAFFMILAFTGVAGVFIMIGADFLAAAQVLVYVGAVAVMFLFAIMVSDLRELSDNPECQPAPAANGRGLWLALSGLVALGFAGLVLAALWRSGVPAVEIPAASGLPTTAPVGRALFGPFLVPFEVASVVLLVALVGAIVVAGREDDRPAALASKAAPAAAAPAPASEAPTGKGDAA